MKKNEQNKDIDLFSINEGSSLLDAMRKFEANGSGLIFAVDCRGRLTGSLTDGDARRAILNGVTTDSRISEIMNRGFVAEDLGGSFKDNSDVLEKYKIVPILEKDGTFVGVLASDPVGNVPINKPFIPSKALSYVIDCLTSGWISSQGAYVSRFEKLFEQTIGLPNAVSTSNGTTAIELALSTFGIGAGDNVIVPNWTFGATANAVLAVGANPIFVDCNNHTWALDHEIVKSVLEKNVKAVVPVDIYGRPCDILSLRKIVGSEVKIIQDCAESLGAIAEGRQSGGFADACTFSFFANKIITTGEGGMVSFSSKEKKELALTLRDHGMDPTQRYRHLKPGFNFRMTNLQAAVGCAQLEVFEDILLARKNIYDNYKSLLEFDGFARSFDDAEGMISAPWLYTCLLKGKVDDNLVTWMVRNGIEVRRVFSPLNVQPAFEHYEFFSKEGANNTLSFYEHAISLPTFFDMRLIDVERVCMKLREYYNAT